MLPGRPSCSPASNRPAIASVPGFPLTNYVRVLIARGWANRSFPELRFAHPRAIKTRT